jgi:hypothetical protein
MNSRYVIMMLALVLFFVTDAAATQRTALVIGNSSYEISPLKNPVNDATDMANTLTRSGFNVSLKINADERTMVTAIREFGRQIKQDGGVGLFYYAGHGIQVRGRNYLIPLEAVIESEGDVRFEAVDAGFVLSKMEDAGNDMNIVILDACRNNPFARNFRSSTQGLARMDAPKGSIIAYATAPGELAADGTGRNGIYTKHLIHNIQAPQLRLEDVFKNVRRAVVNETGNKQVPWESSSLMGQFYFIQAQPQPQTTSTTAKKDTSIDSSYEILFWESIKNSGNVDDFKAYLEQYPNGVFVSLAKNKLKRSEFSKKTTPPTPKKVLTKNSLESQDAGGILTSSIDPKKKDHDIVASDGTYIKYRNGIVYDKRTGLEWVAAPDSYYLLFGIIDAIRWVDQLSLDGGGWRMPSINELKSLYQKKAGHRNMTNLLRANAWYILSKDVTNVDWRGLNFETFKSFDFRCFSLGCWGGRYDHAAFTALAVRTR